MTSLIFDTVVRALTPLLLFFSIFLLVTGHNEPGGGFAGGLVAASAFVLQAIARSPADARRALRVRLRALLGVGLLCAMSSGLWSSVRGGPFLTGAWVSFDAGALGVIELGTPLLFDVGVYLVVIAATLVFVLFLAEE